MRAETQRETQEKLIEILEQVAPGMELREAIDRILQVGTGALIVVGSLDELRNIMGVGSVSTASSRHPGCLSLRRWTER